MATTFEALRDAITTRISTVANAGVVQSRERWSDNFTDFLALFKDTPSSSVRGWTVTWTDNKNVEDDYCGFGQVAYEYHFVVRGYLSFNDADNTEDTFNVLVEGVRDALIGQRTWGVTGIVPFSTVVEVDHHEKRIFGSVLCHYAELHIKAVLVEAQNWA